jgi:hypothetical protein
MQAEDPTLDELVEILVVRLRDADAVASSELHSFKELMLDYADLIPDNWYWETFEELNEQGLLHDASTIGNQGTPSGGCRRMDACT